MDQGQLHALEDHCIQEQPSQCQAACPLRVDGRAFAGRMAKGQWDEARKILGKTMPFPGVLGRLCDGPCQSDCKRGEAGGPIQISALERACVTRSDLTQRVTPLPARNKRAAIVGAGLAGLTAAWDLGRKGFPVSVFAEGPTLGAALLAHYPGQLPEDVAEQETAVLKKLGVSFLQRPDIGTSNFLNELLDEFDAVCLSLDAIDSMAWPLKRDPGLKALLDRTTWAASLDRVFGCGLSESPVWRSAEGRFAATSMDRLMQGVSLTARRGDEGPFETRLFVSLEGIEPRAPIPMSDPAAGYSEAEAVEEAARCLQCECLECVKQCAYLEAFKGYPKKYARQIYNNESIVKGNRQANRLINSCMLCGQCSVICPNDFPMAELCLETRQAMTRRGSMPPSAHDFAMEDLEFNTSGRFALARHAPGQDASDHLFFPGCQLAGSSPGHVERSYAWLREALSPRTGLMLGCCGAPALWAGQEERFAEVLGSLRDQAADFGRPRLITACATCAAVLAEHAPDLSAVSLWEAMAGHDLGKANIAAPLALHDPCSARHDQGMRDAARAVMAGLGIEVEELRMGRELTSCCGYGGLLYNANPPLAREVAKKRVSESDKDFIAYCAMCRDNLAKTGKRTWHLLDLVFPNPDEPDPAALPGASFSQRHENRTRLRRSLLKNLWNEEPEDMDEREGPRLNMSPEVRERCEQRLILEEDLRRVILRAEKTGRKLHDPKTGRFLAYRQPARVTYWVEYEPEPDAGEGMGAFRVHNAYSHRMTIPGGSE